MRKSTQAIKKAGNPGTLRADCQNNQQNDCNQSNSQRLRRPIKPNLREPRAAHRSGTPFQQQLPINPAAGSQLLRARNETPNFDGTASGGGLDSLQQLAAARDAAGLDAQSLGSSGGALDDSGNESRASRIAQMMSSAQGSPTGRGDLAGLSLSVDPAGVGSMSNGNGVAGRSNYAQLNSERRCWNRELRGEKRPARLCLPSHGPSTESVCEYPLALRFMYVQASNKPETFREIRTGRLPQSRQRSR